MNKCLYEECDKEAKVKYCSLSCGTKQQMLNNRRSRVAEYATCSFIGCENQWEKTSRNKKQKFCGHSCSASYSNSLREKPVKSSCIVCGKVAAKKYCSRECSGKGMKAEKLKVWLETGDAITTGTKTHYVREYIYNEQNHLCAICSMPQLWNGKELTFVLDHIDGNSDNNHRGNLRLVCPNCDSQLDTYKSKNKGNGRHFRRERYAAGKSF